MYGSGIRCVTLKAISVDIDQTPVGNLSGLPSSFVLPIAQLRLRTRGAYQAIVIRPLLDFTLGVVYLTAEEL